MVTLIQESIVGISHINVVVDDIEIATEYYERLLGFVPARDKKGQLMDYPNIELPSFARNAGFQDGIVDVDIRFLKQQNIGIYLELMKYKLPIGKRHENALKTNDFGGIRHVALEVVNIDKLLSFLRAQPDVPYISIPEDQDSPEELTPYPIKFFYWIDRYNVQWEFEQGRKVGNVVHGITV